MHRFLRPVECALIFTTSIAILHPNARQLIITMVSPMQMIIIKLIKVHNFKLRPEHDETEMLHLPVIVYTNECYRFAWNILTNAFETYFHCRPKRMYTVICVVWVNSFFNFVAIYDIGKCKTSYSLFYVVFDISFCFLYLHLF